MPRIVSIIAALFLALLAVVPARAQDATPVPRQPGELAAAQREFNADPQRTAGTLDFQFRVAAFDTPEHAHAAILVVGPALRSDASFTDIQEQKAPQIADESLVYTGHVKQDNLTYKVAILVLRDGRYAHAWVGVGYLDDSLPDLLAVAHRLFARSATPEAGTPSAATGSLLDRLPGLDDLPPGGYRLVEQHTENGAGTPTP